MAPAEGAHNDDDNEDDNESQQSDTDLSHPVKELCKTIDAFIYVVDSSADSQRGKNVWNSQNIFRLLLLVATKLSELGENGYI